MEARSARTINSVAILMFNRQKNKFTKKLSLPALFGGLNQREKNGGRKEFEVNLNLQRRIKSPLTSLVKSKRIDWEDR